MEMESEHTVTQEVIYHVIITADYVKDKPYYDYIVIFSFTLFIYTAVQKFAAVFESLLLTEAAFIWLKIQ